MADLVNNVIVTCRRLPGARFGSTVLVCEHNHVWHKNSPNESFYRCSEKGGCFGRIKVLENGTYLMTNGHNGHANKAAHIAKNVAVNEMMTRARNTRESMRSIFEGVRDAHPNVTIAYDAKLQRKMQRARRANQPAVPQSVDEAEASLINNEHYNLTKDGNSQFFHGRVSTETGTALVFISLGILPMLRNSEEIACDGTFATLPFLFAQLFTIHVTAYRYMFPLAYAIMTEKTQALYSLVFDKVIEVLRTTGDGAITIIRMVSDYEFAILNSMTAAFPGGIARGCWFHFGQAIFRKITSEGLKDSYTNIPSVQKIIKMLIALALLPAAQAHDGFMHIQREAVGLLVGETPEVRAKIQIIFEYMQNYWFNVVTPERFSVYGQSRRTTNEVESFHRWFNARCGKYHQSFWTFIEYLQKVESSTLKDFHLASRGEIIRREQGVAQKRKDNQIRLFAEALANRQMTNYQYLEVCSRFFEPAFLPVIPEEPFDLHNSSNDEIQAPVPAVRGRIARRARAARARRGVAVARGVIVRAPAVRVYVNRRNHNGRGGGAIGGAIPIPAALGPLVQAPDAPEVPHNNPPPPVNEEDDGVLAVNGADCEICRVGNRRSRVFLPCGHCVCSECADKIVIWFGTDETCTNESKCFFCRMRVASVHRIFI